MKPRIYNGKLVASTNKKTLRRCMNKKIQYTYREKISGYETIKIQEL